MEIWLEIEEAPRYLISNIGRVVNRMNDHILKPFDSGNGYLKVNLIHNGKMLQRYVHRLVAETFYDLNDIDGLCVNHVDGDKLNNCVWNLEWVSYSDNNKHALRTGLRKPSHMRSIRLIETGEVFSSLAECSRSIDGTLKGVWKALNGQTRSHRGYTFEYVE